MKKFTTIILGVVIFLFITGFNVLNKPELINRIEIEAKFVTGNQLKVLDQLVESKNKNEYFENDIYLVAKCTPKENNPGKRILNLKVEFISPIEISGYRIDLIPSGGGFLAEGSTYSVTKVISSDRIMPPHSRETILKTKPEFKVIDLSAK